MKTEQDVIRIRDSLHRMERGMYAPLKLSWISNRICWLWKFKKIDEATMQLLTEEVTNIYVNTPYAENYM